jgi:CRP/FNR family cyclic AMP-dependent transcriptional regulator
MTSKAVLQALQSMEFTSDLTVAHLEKIAKIATQVTFSEGATVFREGDATELVYLIEDGRVALQTRVPGHGQVTILTVGPGDFLAWSSLFPPQRKTASGRAVTPTRAIAINASQLLDLCQAEPDIGMVIMWRVAAVISERLRAARMQLLDVFAPSS